MVLLNLGRIVAGVANLAVVPFREGIVQGIMFLIPPLTFFYLSSHWKTDEEADHADRRCRSRRSRLVFLAFTFVPSLRKDGKMVSAEGPQGRAPRRGQVARGGDDRRGQEGEDGRRRGPRQKAEKKLGDAAGQINSIGQPVDAGKAPEP